MSNITLNIVEPGSGPTPDPVVPNTGLFTHGIGGPEATIITVSTILVLALVAFVVWYYKKHTNIHLSNITKHIKTRKSIPIGLTVLAILVSAGTFASLLINAGKSNTNAVEGEDDSSLTVDVSDEELTIEVGSEPVFAVLPVKASVEEATQAGYTLTAYAGSTDLVSTTDPDNTIPMIAVDEADLSENELATLVSLTDNTYGLALGEEPTSKDEAVYTALSTDSLNPTIIKSMTEYTPTAENDTTTIYYGFYITPDIPYGTYTNDGEVHYNATINTTPVTFDGKGLYFNDDEQQTTNTVEYIAVSQENNETETSSTINQPISGEYKTPSQSLPYRFLGWSTNPESAVPTYTSEDDIAEHLPISPNTPLTLYAVWQKATTITYDSNDGVGEMDKQTIIAGESDNLYPNEFTREGYHFTGWNTDTEGTGEAYADEAEYAAIAGESANVTLYAQWEENILYMQDVATWGSALSIGDEVVAVDNRDGKEYTIAKLKDGKVWMTRNLDLQKEDLLPGVTLDSTNTDHPTEGFVLPDSDWSNVNNAQVYDLNNNGETYHYCTGYNLYGDCTTYSDKAIPSEDLGNYYNWYSATAGTGSQNYSGDVAIGSICPAGWRLPTGAINSDTATDYSTLLYVYSIITSATGSATIDSDKLPTMFEPPLSLVRAGQYDSSASDVGVTGVLWSSMSYGIYFGYASAGTFQFGGTRNRLSLRTGQRADGGCSVRCVAR